MSKSRVLLDRYPEKPEDCPFVQPYNASSNDNHLPIPNCQLRINEVYGSEGSDGYSYGPNKCNCLLAAGKTCEYIASIKTVTF